MANSNKTATMTGLKVMVYGGRLLFVLFLLLQCGLFNVFFITYSNPIYSLLSFLYVPGLITWIIFVVQEGSFRWLWLVLASHVWIALVPCICVLLSDVVESIDEEDILLGPSSLKLTISITPILVLLMLNTGPPREKHRGLLKTLSATISLEMFDAIEILEMLMNKKEESEAIPDQFYLAVGILACMSLTVSPLELMEIFVPADSGKIRTLRAPFTVRFFLQVVVANCSFLAVRLILWLSFGQEASIFLVKNILKITTCCFEVCIVFKLGGCHEDEDEDEEDDNKKDDGET